jgi:uncharacterized protein YggE
MDTTKLFASIAAGAIMLSPVATFAADAAVSDISEEDILEVIDTMPANEGRGGGAMSIMPPYYGGGIAVDASITKEVKPDFVALNAYCDIGMQSSREAAKMAADKMFTSVKNAVGADGRVRRTGGVSVYPYYDPMGKESSSFTANLSLFIRITKATAAERAMDAVEQAGCSGSWDVRLTDPQSFEMDVLDDLVKRLNKRKAVFEKLLGKKLNRVVSASLNTWADGYSSYDPETNTVDATTTLSISFDAAGRTPATTRTRAMPKG